ncbi:protein DD3-3-like [Ptychodera flava]|uniref:protein DD3-3-like n=1 Tax=Ptychodera flava TaxID=63121 RepID=UPI00396AABCD
MNSIAVFVALLVTVHADIYLHNPRGSNNRLDENSRNRQNANRMFDSQNNNRGGYNVGGLYYYEGSVLQIEWTNQHSCADPNSHCELILQYMCHDDLRDGAVRGTIPQNAEDCANNDCNRDIEYGMQESYDSYTNCRLRERNQGLFTADQNLKGNSAKYTRQNANGNRYGYECPEERDYYPYWQPTEWKDIAIMTNNARRCPFYEEESENVKSRWACQVPQGYIDENINSNQPIIPTNKEDCENIVYPAGDENGERAEWKEFPSHGLPAPICHETEWTRDNHLGNGQGGFPNTFNWTIPENINHEHCALRLRYNISTGEFDGWNPAVNSTLNKQGNQESKLDVHSRVGLPNREDAENRGYVFEQNPNVKIFNEFDDDDDDFALQLAVNTNQYGRTFQDRSHSFAIRARPAELQGRPIHNLNVRGKRGNIVQVYPSVEYDFVPNNLIASNGDYVHIQWTGSNTNNNNNDGQGLAGTDRSNMVLLGEQIFPEGQGNDPYKPYSKYGHYGLNYPMHLDNVTIAGFTRDDLVNLATVNPNQFRGELSELDDAGTYFDLGPRRVTQSGYYHYMCTRNNNFSNRSQKGKLAVVDQQIAAASIGWNGGSLTASDGVASVTIERGTFEDLQRLQLEVWGVEQGEAALASQGRKISVGANYASDYVVLYPQQQMTPDDKVLTMKMKVTMPSTDDYSVYRTNSENFASWHKVSAQLVGDEVIFETDRGGVYVVRTEPDVVAIVGIVIGCVAVLAIVIGTIIYFRRHPDHWDGLKGKCSYAKKSTQNKV